MSRENIFTGTTANDGTGDTLRQAFTKTNNNFIELYSQAVPGGNNTQLQYNNAGAFAGASGLTTNGTELTIASGTKAADAPVLNMSQTWNNGAVTFTGLKFNVVSDTSAAASLLMDLQVGGTTRARLIKDGTLQLGGATSELQCLGVTLNNGTIGNTAWGVYLAGNSGDMTMRNTGSLAWTNGVATLTKDLLLTRRAAANLRFGAADAAAPVAQTLSVQSVVAGTTNAAGANFTITGSQGTGTGAGGSIIFQVAPAGGSGAAQNGLVNALTIDSNRNITIGGPYNDFQFRVPTGGGSRVFTVVDGATSVLTTSISGTVAVSSFGLGATIAVADVILARDAANTLALRNGANAQAFNIYGTYTDASNYERLTVSFSGGQYNISSNALGTGSARAVGLSVGASLGISPSGTTPFTWTVTSSGHFLANADNTYDIGASGATRPRNVYVAFLLKSTYIETNASVPAGNGGIAIGQSVINSNASGVISLSNYSAGNDFNRLQFGGTTSSFPALKRSSTTLQARLADDSDYTTIDALLRSQGTAPASATATGTAGDIRYDSGFIYVCTATNTWKRVAIATW